MPTNQRLIAKYLPANYMDSHSVTLTGKPEWTPRDLFEALKENRPKCVSLTCKFRDLLVKPLGLKPRCIFTETVVEEDDYELIVGGEDVHMDFHVSVFCPPKMGEEQTVTVTAAVAYKKPIAAAYFLLVWGFYWRVIKQVMKKVVK